MSKLAGDYLRLTFDGTPFLKSNALTLKAVLKKFESRYASEISPKELEQYRANRKLHVSTSTINKEMALLKAAYNAAKKWGEVTENPVNHIKIL